MADDEKHDDKADDPGEAIRKMAAEYVDLWEQQMGALAKDEKLAETMAQTVQLMNAGAVNMASMMQSFAGAGGGTQGATDDGADSHTDADAKAAAPASGDADVDLRTIARRLADIEERLDRLESAASGKGKSRKR